MAIFDYNPSAITPFPYWRWNKVLPAVYDDSVSQYEMLCRLLSVVNNIIESTNSTGEQVEALTQLVQQLIDGGFPSGLVDYVNDIVDAAMADDIEAINATLADMQEEIDKISNTLTNFGGGYGIYGIARNYALNNYSDSQQRLLVFHSIDGISINYRAEIPIDNWGYNATSITYYDGYFIMVNGNVYRTSKDLITWSANRTISGIYSAGSSTISVWGTYICVIDDKLYICTANRYNNNTISQTGTGGSSYYFVIEIYETTFANGILTATTKYNPIPGWANNSYIDPSLIKHPTIGYILAVKNEITSKIEIWHGSSLTDMQKANIECLNVGCEAPKLIKDGVGNVYVYCDPYNFHTVSTFDTDYQYSACAVNTGNRYLRALVATGQYIDTYVSPYMQYNSNDVATSVITVDKYAFVPYLLWETINTGYKLRHASFVDCGKNEFNVLGKLGTISVPSFFDVYADNPILTNITGKVKVTNISGNHTVFRVRYPCTAELEYRQMFVPRDEIAFYIKGNSTPTQLASCSISMGRGFSSYNGTAIPMNSNYLKDGILTPAYYDGNNGRAGCGCMLPW